MFNLKDIIFSFFGGRDSREDFAPDVNNKGLTQRFNELLAGDFDDNELAKINEIVANTSDPRTLLIEFLPLMESQWGNPVIFSNLESDRRKVLRFATQLYRIKGTKLGYTTAFLMMGLDTVVINETFVDFTWDDPAATLDDDERRFDNTCDTCSEYDIELTGSLPVTQEFITYVYNIIKFNEPINAVLKQVLYNGTILLVQNLISISINAIGDLIYDNAFDPQLIITVDANGDFQISGPNAAFYSIDANGDLIYTP